MARVLQEQRLDVVDAVEDLAVDRLAAQRRDRARNDVGEAPAELAERGRVAGRRQRVGEPRRDLRDAAEVADRVVARAHRRKAEVEEIEAVEPAGARRFRVAALHQLGIALGIDHDHDVAAADVLGCADLQQPRLADPRGAVHDEVRHALGQVGVDRLLVHRNGMDVRVATDRRQRRDRVPPDAARRDRGELGQHARALDGVLEPPRGVVGAAGIDEPLHLGAARVAQPLRVLLAPAEAQPEVVLAVRHRHLARLYHEGGQPLHAALVAHHAPALMEPVRREAGEQYRCGGAHHRRHQQRPRRPLRHRACAGGGRGAPELHGRTQQRVDGVRGRHHGTIWLIWPSAATNRG